MPDCLVSSGEKAVPVDAVTVSGLQQWLSEADAHASAWVRAVGFTGATGEVTTIPAPDGAIGAALFGLGNGEAGPSLLAGKLATVLPAGTYALRSGFGDAELAALAFALGAYRFTRYRAPKSGARRLAVPENVSADEVSRIADGVYLARDLINTPANDLGPAEIAAAAADLAAKHGAAFREVVGDELSAGFPLIAAVGAAAEPARTPRLVDLSWGRSGDPLITLVGKGVAFDTGGLDIKTSSGMLLMKKDMGGAANALGLAHMVMSANLRLRLRVIIPTVENAISGSAFRPGDILRSRKGDTIEIGNTDAEGRLILADALTLAAEAEPNLIIDLATLTGAARVALGPDIPPFYTRDDDLASELSRHAHAVADPLWRLPLWKPYAAMLESSVADINNAGQSAFAGSITAALFLSRFVPEAMPWLHADIFGWTPSAKPGKPEGAEAQAIRAIYALLKERHPA